MAWPTLLLRTANEQNRTAYIKLTVVVLMQKRKLKSSSGQDFRRNVSIAAEVMSCLTCWYMCVYCVKKKVVTG